MCLILMTTTITNNPTLDPLPAEGIFYLISHRDGKIAFYMKNSVYCQTNLSYLYIRTFLNAGYGNNKG